MPATGTIQIEPADVASELLATAALDAGFRSEQITVNGDHEWRWLVLEENGALAGCPASLQLFEDAAVPSFAATQAVEMARSAMQRLRSEAAP